MLHRNMNIVVRLFNQVSLGVQLPFLMRLQIIRKSSHNKSSTGPFCKQYPFSTTQYVSQLCHYLYKAFEFDRYRIPTRDF